MRLHPGYDKNATHASAPGRHGDQLRAQARRRAGLLVRVGMATHGPARSRARPLSAKSLHLALIDGDTAEFELSGIGGRVDQYCVLLEGAEDVAMFLTSWVTRGART